MKHAKIFIPKESHFSVGTSPYYAHQKAVAIDIYHEISLDNYDVFSPVSGKVIETKELLAPKPRFKDGINKEYLTLIQNPHDINTVFKILHVKPAINKGDEIKVGDIIGTTIKNGYFAPWSSPHLHLELKKPEEAQRAKGGLHFDLNTRSLSHITHKTKYFGKIPINIVSKHKEFLLCQFPDKLYNFIDPFYGVRAEVNDLSCIIDGGIPIYKNGVIHFPNTIKEISNSPFIRLNNIPIGKLKGIQNKFGYVEFLKPKFSINSIEIRGISLFLAFFFPLVKIVPYSMTDSIVDTTQFLSIES